MPDIYYVLNSRFPTIKAYGLQVAKTCESFKRAGAKVRLLVPIRQRSKELGDRSVPEIYAIKDKFRIVRLPSFDFLLLGLGGRFFFAVQQFSFAVSAWLYLLRKNGIIYSRDQFSLYALSFFKPNLYWEVHRIPKNLDSKLYHRLLSKLSGIVAITHGLKKELAKHFDENKIIVAPDGIDLDEFDISVSKQAARERLGFPLEKKIVLYSGHLFEWKGTDTLVEAARDLSDDLQVIIVGGTKEDIGKMKNLDRTGKVSFEGYQPHDSIPLYLAAADIVVLPNKRDGGISEFYTSPLKMFEYMAAGKPIIASDLPSIREVLNENNSLLIKPDDSKILSNAIKDLLQNPEKMSKLAEKARLDAGKYSWLNRAHNILNFINGNS